MTRTPWVLSPWLCQILPLAKWPWKTTCAIAMFDGKSQLPNKSKASNGALRSLLLEQYPEIIQWSNQAVNQSLSALGLTESICQSIAWIPLDLEALTSMCALHWKNSLKIPLHTPRTRSEKACHFRQACLGSHMSHPSGGFFKSQVYGTFLEELVARILGLSSHWSHWGLCLRHWNIKKAPNWHDAISYISYCRLFSSIFYRVILKVYKLSASYHPNNLFHCFSSATC